MPKGEEDKLKLQTKLLDYVLSSVKEVVFIVLGILIALYINDWDANRKNISSAQEFIKDINFDLKKDTTIFGAEVRKIDVITNYQKYILNNKNLDSLSTEDIMGIIGGGYHNIKIYDASFIRMKTSEVFHLDEYEDIFKKINTYYSFYEVYLGNRNEWETEMQGNAFKFLAYQNEIEMNYDDKIKIIQSEKERRKAVLKMLNSIEGRNNLKNTLLREETMKDTYKRILSIATKLISKTDSILVQSKLH